MKYCSNCGAVLLPDSKFCNECGSKVIESVVVNSNTPTVNSTNYVAVKTQAKCWTVFAKIGFGVGLAGLICSFIYVYGIIISAHGLVFSILGLRSYHSHGKAVAGMIMSIVGIALGFILSVMCVVCIINLGDGSSSGFGDYYFKVIQYLF